MAAIEPSARLNPYTGLWNGAGLADTDLFNAGHADDRTALRLRTFIFENIEPGDFWESGIRGIVALAVQSQPNLRASAFFASAADARAGRVTFEGQTPDPRNFWLYVWSRGR